MSLVDYCIIIPVYNSSVTLEQLHSRLTLALQAYTYELVFVDDNSTDDSWNRLQLLAAADTKHSSIIHLSKNTGQHQAIFCGLHYTNARFIITLDDDLQHAPESIALVIAKQRDSDADLVYGIYIEKNHSWLRNLGSLCIQLVFRKVFGAQGQITSFRLFKSELAQKITAHKPSYVFIDGLLHWHTASIERVSVPHYARVAGRSGYSFYKLLSLSASLLFNFSTLPLRLISLSGFVISSISFLLGIIFIIRKFIMNVPIGFTAVIVSIFFSSGVFILMLGILSEYLSRIYNQQNQKPLFSVSKHIRHD